MRALHGHTQFVQSIAFAPDGATLASASADGTVKLWDLAKGRERTLIGHKGWVGSVAFSPDSKWLASGGHDRTILLRALPGGKARKPYSLEREIVSIAFSPDGKSLAWGGYGCIGSLAELSASGPRRLPFLGLVTSEKVFAVRFAPDGATLAAAGTGATVEVRDLPALGWVGAIEHGDAQGCRALSFHPNGQALALALGSGAQVRAYPSGACLAELTEHNGVVSAVNYAPDGRLLLTGGWDGTARLYDVDARSGAPLRQRACFDWGLGRVFDVVFAPDGMTAACAGNEGDRLVIWDVE